MFPEMSGYPTSHEVMCFSENETLTPEVEGVLSEVAQYVQKFTGDLFLSRADLIFDIRLPRQADRSLNGIIEFLLHRVVRGEPSPFANQTQHSQDTDEEGYDYEDDLIGIGPEMSKNSELVKALRRYVSSFLIDG